jgi:hypothetical protein
VVIDGGNGGVASNRVEITGANAIATGLSVVGNGNTSQIRNFVINGFTAAQISISTNAVEVQGSFIGLNSAGTAVVPGGHGIQIDSSINNIIGGTSAGQNNVICSKNSDAIELNDANATIQNNFIGVNAAGTAKLGTGDRGIELNGSSSATIGGIHTNERNVIAASVGIDLSGINGNTVIQGNFIGTDVTGTNALNFSGAFGIHVGSATNVTIGGVEIGAGKVISGNGIGIGLSGSSSATTIQSSFIGVGVDGTTNVGNRMMESAPSPPRPISSGATSSPSTGIRAWS